MSSTLDATTSTVSASVESITEAASASFEGVLERVTAVAKAAERAGKLKALSDTAADDYGSNGLDSQSWDEPTTVVLHAGILTKVGGGTSTLGRKSLKERFFVLTKGHLVYFKSPSHREEARVTSPVHGVTVRPVVTAEAEVAAAAERQRGSRNCAHRNACIACKPQQQR